MTLMERAMMKHNESNDSLSQDNFSSDGSRRSNSSRNSRNSLKKESSLNLGYQDKSMIHSKHANIPIQRKPPRGSSHEQEMEEIERQRERERSRERS